MRQICKTLYLTMYIVVQKHDALNIKCIEDIINLLNYAVAYSIKTE
jgi:hypothetical protein